MKLQLFLALLLLAGASRSWGQSLPEKPSQTCDLATCRGCTPFQPPPGKREDNPCGINNVYFPVPVLVIRNDTSDSQELRSAQWACFACCEFGCGFNDPGSGCGNNKYEYVESAKNQFGCSKCGSGKVKNPSGGAVKTFFENSSTKTVYQVMNMEFTSCSVAPPPSPAIPPKVPPPTPKLTFGPAPAPKVVEDPADGQDFPTAPPSIAPTPSIALPAESEDPDAASGPEMAPGMAPELSVAAEPPLPSVVPVAVTPSSGARIAGGTVLAMGGTLAAAFVMAG